MTPKQTALRNTSIVVASGLATGALVSLAFAFLTTAQIGIAACAIILVFGIKMVYDTELSKAETLEKLNK
jgi:hypothetical protein